MTDAPAPRRRRSVRLDRWRRSSSPLTRLRDRATDEFLDRAVEKHSLEMMSSSFDKTADQGQFAKRALNVIHGDRCIAFGDINVRHVVLAHEQIGLTEALRDCVRRQWRSRNA